MALTITEYAGEAFVSGYRAAGVVQDIGNYGSGSSVITTNVISSGGGVSTINLQPTTRMIRIATTANAWVLCSNSTSSTASLVTSTNAPLSPANTIELRGVLPGARITALST